MAHLSEPQTTGTAMHAGLPSRQSFSTKFGVMSGILLLTAMLSGCGKPVPADKADYVGEWTAPEMYLLITSDGSIRYRRLRGGAETSITGPLRGFEGDDFIVGLPLISATFVVTTPPYNDSGTWKMVVDGVELTRAP